jgi:hypothetical protein
MCRLQIGFAIGTIDKPVPFRDIHTTILHQLGLNQDALSYLQLGRKERLTEIQGEVIKAILASEHPLSAAIPVRVKPSA